MQRQNKMETSTYTKELDRKDSIRRNALKGRNAKVYASLCDELGVQPEDIDLYDAGQMEIDFTERKSTSKLEEISNKQAISPVSSTRRTKLDKAIFYRLTRDIRLQKYNPQTQISWKRNIFKKSGYTYLWVGKREKISIDDAKDSRIGNAFKDACLNVERNYTKA